MRQTRAVLYPQANEFRAATRLPDFWEIRFDPDDTGEDEGWTAGFDEGRLVAVPASWNDLFEDGRDDLGPAWYQVTFRSGGPMPGRTHCLRFDSVSYDARVWLNGQAVGGHRGAHLPFECPVDAVLRPGPNTLVVRVDGRLDRSTVPGAPPVPPGGTGTPEGSMLARMAGFMRSRPAANFDFFPYAGIQRPVYLEGRPADGVAGLVVDTDMHGEARVRVATVGNVDAVRLDITGESVGCEVPVDGDAAEATLQVADVELWGVGEPNLYTLVVEAMVGGSVVDVYRTEIGFRSIEIDDAVLKLNGNPLEIRGFGRHEDFPVHGRGYDPAVMIKDYSLLRWVGANSFRTSHYPYCEEQLQLADRIGVLVISEAPAVSFRFDDDDELDARLDQWRRDLDALVARDRNHPSVIMWSVGNEPLDREGDESVVAEMIDRVKALDPTRPVSIDSPMSHRDEAFESSDIVCLHEYPGWYSDQGDLAVGLAHTRRKVESLARQGKPIIITEIGADTIAGHHAQPAEMFSEEYQAELVELVLDLVDDLDALIGVHWWNLCDFKTGQGVLRPKGLNHKGLFTRDRRPKMAAHALRRRWTEETSP